MTEKSIGEFFRRYQHFFMEALAGRMDANELSELYTSDFIAASSAGIMTGKNDDTLRRHMIDGYDHYRAIGTKSMQVRHIRLSPIDDWHAVAHVGWTAVYAKAGQADISIEFDVHYLVQELEGQPKIFGWVSGAEEALLSESGVL